MSPISYRVVCSNGQPPALSARNGLEATSLRKRTGPANCEGVDAPLWHAICPSTRERKREKI